MTLSFAGGGAICGGSQLGPRYNVNEPPTGCLPRLGWQDAQNACREHGARLCLRMESPVTKHTGCGLDDQ